MDKIQCGNDKHPKGAWHEAASIPGSWQWLESYRYWRNKRKYGCGCP